VIDAAPADREGLVPLGPLSGNEAAAAADAGVVEQKVDVVGVEGASGLLGEPADLRLVRDVGEVGADPGALGRPIPVPPPVITAILPAKSFIALSRAGLGATASRRKTPSLYTIDRATRLPAICL
jgi:hypothetical protein